MSALYLTRDQAYRGTCVAVYDRGHATRPSELSAAQWREFCGDVWMAESAVTAAFRPDHVNLELLGNTVPHLLMAVVPRYRSDARWGRPIWTTSRDEMPETLATDQECTELARAMRAIIDSIHR